MIREFALPDLGEGLTESEIVSWKVAEGQSVSLNQVIAEVETAKAVVQLPSPWDGVVERLLQAEGATVDVGTPILAIDVPSAGGSGDGGGEPGTARREPTLVGYGAAPAGTGRPARRRRTTGSPASAGPSTATGTGEPDPGTAPDASPQPGAPGVPDQPDVPAPVGPDEPDVPLPTRPDEPLAPNGPEIPPLPGGPEITPPGSPSTVATAPQNGAASRERHLSTPVVRKLARDLGLDIDAVTGTGRGGLVTRADVTAAAEARSTGVATVAATAPAVTTAAAPTATTGDGGLGLRETREPIRGVRKHTAAAMVASAFTAPHVTEFLTVDVTESVALLDSLRADRAWAEDRPTMTALVAKAVLVALRRHPELNSRWDETAGEIVRFGYVNLGIAAATPRGLVVPNLKDADGMDLRTLSRALRELTSAARDGRTTPAALSGGTFTISNVGVFGVDAGTPILNPGEAGILATGQVRRTPWEYRGEIALRDVMTLSLSFDHRLVDGEAGSRFLADVGAVLRSPGATLTLV
ncbi:dihydrolipoamide acetyltransferase component of pyruvate dehydrogenase complex [Tersicoccus solisilvae]|uniref:Dihydrolipoamide acetyltransferase component of pyruvate dehydrogenase complex n=1 Tax=Tersicoccus solisilvae TaxID=1882339 RepID=A0ABQ1PLY7_9MICC|nr:dihydrolipoamide acetyltransferase family protein [Tersicoccus solisilvae]GGC99319.1 dihydrolipoamide acetyltransferase component of pyruvate dehydrogenase complex [Tersicoccus solisilvae]